MDFDHTPTLIDERRLAEMTGRSVRTVQADRLRGRGIPFIRLGRSIRYDLEVVKRYFADHTVATDSGDEQWPAPCARPAPPPRGPPERPHPHLESAERGGTGTEGG